MNILAPGPLRVLKGACLLNFSNMNSLIKIPHLPKASHASHDETLKTKYFWPGHEQFVTVKADLWPPCSVVQQAHFRKPFKD